MSITAETTAEGVLVRFPKDPETNASFKAAFPRAKWNAHGHAWKVEGTTAARRVAKWIAAAEAAQAAAVVAEAQAKASVGRDAVASRYVARWDAGWCVRTPYGESIVAILRSIPGAAFHRESKGGFWLVPFRSTEALADALPRIEEAADPVVAARDAEKKRREAEYAEKQAAWARERDAARKARDAAHSARRANRFVVLLDRMPEAGVPVRMFGHAVVVEGFGKPFRVDEDMPSYGGAHLLGHEGERCCYAYWRDATAEEVAALEEGERLAAARAEERRAAVAEMRDLERMAETSGEYPEGSRAVAGETLLETNRRLALYGGGSWWVAAEDGLWFVRNNGADGDNWSANNVVTGGAGAIGRRLPRDPDMEGRLRWVASVLGRTG